MSEWDTVSSVFERRRSVRGFLPKPVPRAELEAVLQAAQRAPSWCNVQPWRLVVTGPERTAALSTAMVEAATTTFPKPDVLFPPEYPEPYQTHRRACGYALYGAMGIERSDKERRKQAWVRNYEFFGAPHLAVVSRHERLGEYATLDVGVWLGYLLTAAEARGLAMCPMASTASHPHVLRQHLDIADDQRVLFGIAIGYEDLDAPANSCRTTRQPIADNVVFDW